MVTGTEAQLHTDNLTSVQVSFDPVVNLTQVKLDLWFLKLKEVQGQPVVEWFEFIKKRHECAQRNNKEIPKYRYIFLKSYN